MVLGSVLRLLPFLALGLSLNASTPATFSGCFSSLRAVPSSWFVTSMQVSPSQCPAQNGVDYLYAQVTDVSTSATGATLSGCVLADSFGGLPSGWVVKSTSVNTGACPTWNNASYAYAVIENMNGGTYTLGQTSTVCTLGNAMAGLPAGWLATSTTYNPDICVPIEDPAAGKLIPYTYTGISYLGTSQPLGSWAAGCVDSVSLTAGVPPGWVVAGTVSSCGVIGGEFMYTYASLQNQNGGTSAYGCLAANLGGRPENWIVNSMKSGSASCPSINGVAYDYGLMTNLN